MAISLTGAIKNGLTASANVTALVGNNIWLSQAPEKSGLPLVAIFNGKSQVDWCFGGKTIINSEILIECYAVTAQASEAVKDAVTQALDPYTVVFDTTNTILCCLREAEDIAIEQDRSPDGNPVFKSTTRYMVKVETA